MIIDSRCAIDTQDSHPVHHWQFGDHLDQPENADIDLANGLVVIPKVACGVAQQGRDDGERALGDGCVRSSFQLFPQRESGKFVLDVVQRTALAPVEVQQRDGAMDEMHQRPAESKGGHGRDRVWMEDQPQRLPEDVGGGQFGIFLHEYFEDENRKDLDDGNSAQVGCQQQPPALFDPIRVLLACQFERYQVVGVAIQPGIRSWDVPVVHSRWRFDGSSFVAGGVRWRTNTIVIVAIAIVSAAVVIIVNVSIRCIVHMHVVIVIIGFRKFILIRIGGGSRSWSGNSQRRR
mmetsp:Transcript_20342/g.57780  ORF Transcript_20342/g.57780 Transcript_20342/m.57780 type:complete len:290 (+) Transcript_20342:689-1558(+)